MKAIIDNPTPYLGAEVLVAGDLLNLHEMAKIYTKGIVTITQHAS